MGPAILKDYISSPPSVIHPGLVGCRKTSVTFNFGWTLDLLGNFKIYLCPGLILTNWNYLCRWGMRLSILKLHWLYQWTTKFEKYRLTTVIFKFGFHNYHWERSCPCLLNEMIHLHNKVCKPQIYTERICFFWPKDFCSLTPSISSSNPGNSCHYLSWLKCNYVN